MADRVPSDAWFVEWESDRGVAVIFPLRRDLPDVGEHGTFGSLDAAMNTTRFRDNRCVLCRLGVCLQKYAVDTGSAPRIVHRMAGVA